MSRLFRIYMDDSGNVDRNTSNDPNSRYGSVSAVILDAEYLDKTFNPSFSQLVERHFGRREDGNPVNLHRRLLAKPPAKGPFSVLNDPARRQQWDASSLRMYEKAQYTVITACVDKVDWYWRYPDWQGDFYEIIVQAILERSFYFLRDKGKAEVNIENKDDKRNLALKNHYNKGVTSGFQFISGEQLSNVFTSKELNILHKDDCIPGLQLADLIAHPALVATRYINTRRHPATSDYVESVCNILEEHKFYRGEGGSPHNYGRIWRPNTGN